MAKFEIALRPNDLCIKGKVDIFERASTSDYEEVPDIAPPPNEGPSNMIIQYDQPWFARFYWSVKGPLTRLLKGGNWKCDLLFEAMGEPETKLNPHVMVPAEGKPYDYTADVDVRNGQLQDGVYRVVARLQYYDGDDRPMPIVGFEDSHVVQVYHEK